MKAPKISVIIPMYGVEKFLSKCLESVSNQSFSDFEVILIDDGSTDASGKIADEFSKNRDNFFVFHNKNKGLPSARNFGLKKARGEYISFIDSDDYIHKDFLKKLYELIRRHDADIACCNYYLFFPEKKLKLPYPIGSFKNVYSTRRALEKLISWNSIHSFVWNKLYKKSLFLDNGIKFYNICFEDVAIMPRLFFYSKKVSVTNKPLYYYTQRKGSILGSINANKVDELIRSFGSIRNFLQKQKEYENYEKSLISLGKKVKAMKNLYIFNLHLKALNFKGIRKNLKNSSKSVRFFLEEDYESSTEVPETPFSIDDPERSFEK